MLEEIKLSHNINWGVLLWRCWY